jgi:hypothetical protein
MRRFIKALVLFVAVFSMLAAGPATAAVPRAAEATAASSASLFGCHGYPVSMYASGSSVFGTYRISCTQRVDYINLYAELTGPSSNAYRQRGECYNALSCDATAIMPNPSGSQLFHLGAYKATATKGSSTTGCGWFTTMDMTCTMWHKYF